jgi:peptidoglycan/LPS O-acetylase OafA/YrhL
MQAPGRNLAVADDAAAPRPQRVRLDYLDGLRGAASLYVVIFHVATGFTRGELPAWGRALRRVLTFGHEAVAIFIVLSGYCLMLPVARAADGRLARGAVDYLRRRARRILPPYYAALLGTLVLIALIPALRPPTPTGTIWDDSNPAFTTGPLLSHLFLVHNWSPAWAMRINGPLWSVATEWQIYFFFPFVLLPVWRRAGLGVLAVAVAIGYLPTFLWPANAASAVTWYLALFALGMVAAAVAHGTRDRPLAEAVPWAALTWLLVAACLVGGFVFAKSWFPHKPRTDLLVGLATATLLVHCTRRLLDGGARPAVLRLLDWPRLVGLGHFSYSLYLTHLPVIALGHLAVSRLPLGPIGHTLVLLALGVPASVGVAYAFHVAIERRFMRV